MSATDKILDHFEKLSAVPRGTKNEAAIRQWLIEWAALHGLAYKTDAIGNLVIIIPASPGLEKRQTLILQGHLDMVCEKTPDSKHDFNLDPIRVIRAGDWLRADQTTLGADNGIAIAIGMAIAEDTTLIHPQLELLFTVEEELGITGADNIDPALITGKSLVNLDSEEDGVFTVGCAGGGTTYMTLPVYWTPASKDEPTLELKVGGLRGGHSGEDIDKHRGNAIKILARVLDEIQCNFPIRLVTWKGGTARNAIPRDATTTFLCPPDNVDTCKAIIESIEKTIQAEFTATEPGLFIELSRLSETADSAIGVDETKRGIQLAVGLPNGVSEMSAAIEGFVETSNNIGVIELLKDGLLITSNQRSSVFSRLEEMTRKIEALAALAGAGVTRTKLNHPWQPNMNSPLLKKCVETYETLYQQKPRVELSHGGLECGVISDRCNGLDTISLGPTIKNPHSPDEMLFLPSLSRTWDFLTALLRSI
ncbi:MAG: beta-Ala-His dipeptidase [Chloroflexi bacterium]|nr:beta-Ala-His dipeptidase [Chloroflexota bacterium]